MGGSTPVTFEILAHQDDGLCGVALYASDQNWHDCAADVGVFEQVDWAVPHDGSVHTISVGFSIQLGSAACCPGSSNPWKSTSVTFTVNGGDFSINANPTSISVPLGTRGSSTISVSPINGLTDPVRLTVSSPALNCDPIQPSITGAGTATLSCSGVAVGTYTATVTGTAGPYNELQHSTTVTFNIQDFRISAAGSIDTYSGPNDGGS